jgi:hypothetical protein
LTIDRGLPTNGNRIIRRDEANQVIFDATTRHPTAACGDEKKARTRKMTTPAQARRCKAHGLRLRMAAKSQSKRPLDL